jgi:hypothetical protein
MWKNVVERGRPQMTIWPKFIIVQIACLSFEFFFILFTLVLCKAVLCMCVGFNVGCSPAVFKAVFMCAGFNVGCSPAVFKAVFMCAAGFNVDCSPAVFMCAVVNVGCSCVCVYILVSVIILMKATALRAETLE